MYEVATPARLTLETLTIFSITDRTKRIKEAKAEAQKEIEEYRGQKEEEYKKFEAEVSRRPLQ